MDDDSPQLSRTWLESFKRQLIRTDAIELEEEDREPSRICLRLQMCTFEDARAAAEGLRSGVPQIVSLTNAPAEIAQRLIDFLQGVTYVLHGFQTYVSPTIFLFTPGSVEIVPGDVLPMGSAGYITTGE